MVIARRADRRIKKMGCCFCVVGTIIVNLSWTMAPMLFGKSD
jgi:hypothetical protein